MKKCIQILALAAVLGLMISGLAASALLLGAPQPVLAASNQAGPASAVPANEAPEEMPDFPTMPTFPPYVPSAQDKAEPVFSQYFDIPGTQIPAPAAPSEEILDLSAEKAFVYDRAAGEFLYLKGGLEDRIYPASLTKLMTAYTVLTLMSLDRELTVPSDALALVEPDSAVAGLHEGDTLTVEMLLRALLLPSGGDAAHVLAVLGGRELAQDPELGAKAAQNRFIEEMNLQAQELGLTGSHFATCDGMDDPGQYTCMSDILRLALMSLNTPVIRSIVDMGYADAELAGGGRLHLHNTNYLQCAGNHYYRDNAIGLKTGTTGLAGYCLLSAFQLEDRVLIIGTFRCPDDASRFENALTLYDFYKTEAKG